MMEWNGIFLISQQFRKEPFVCIERELSQDLGRIRRFYQLRIHVCRVYDCEMALGMGMAMHCIVEHRVRDALALGVDSVWTSVSEASTFYRR